MTVCVSCHLRKGTRNWNGSEVNGCALNDVRFGGGGGEETANFRKILIDLLRVVLFIAFIVSSSMELIFFNEIIALRVESRCTF